MSLSSLTTLAVIRDSAPPKKGDIGKAKTEPEKDKVASLPDLLVTLVPTELVAPYTVAAAGVVGAIDDPSVTNPHPDEFTVIRWLLFAGLIATVAVWVWADKRRKPGAGTRFPLPELIGAVVAAGGWALALPMSPLAAHLDGEILIVIPIAVAFFALAINIAIAKVLQSGAA